MKKKEKYQTITQKRVRKRDSRENIKKFKEN